MHSSSSYPVTDDGLFASRPVSAKESSVSVGGDGRNLGQVSIGEGGQNGGNMIQSLMGRMDSSFQAATMAAVVDFERLMHMPLDERSKAKHGGRDCGTDDDDNHDDDDECD